MGVVGIQVDGRLHFVQGAQGGRGIEYLRRIAFRDHAGAAIEFALPAFVRPPAREHQDLAALAGGKRGNFPVGALAGGAGRLALLLQAGHAGGQVTSLFLQHHRVEPAFLQRLGDKAFLPSFGQGAARRRRGFGGDRVPCAAPTARNSAGRLLV